MRKAAICIEDVTTGWLTQDDKGYHFVYDSAYINMPNPKPVSLTLPIREEPYVSKTMFAFFDGLIPEGWLLDIAEKNWKLDPRDRMGLLLVCCRDCIGNVSVVEIDQDSPSP
jgi:serine/threonine-protein kinase HipA